MRHPHTIICPSFPRRRESRSEANWIPASRLCEDKLRGNDAVRISFVDIMKQPAVYILASRRNGTLYIGVTSNLRRRIWEHKNDVAEGFTKKYGVHRLREYFVAKRPGQLKKKLVKRWVRTSIEINHREG